MNRFVNNTLEAKLGIQRRLKCDGWPLGRLRRSSRALDFISSKVKEAIPYSKGGNKENNFLCALESENHTVLSCEINYLVSFDFPFVRAQNNCTAKEASAATTCEALAACRKVVIEALSLSAEEGLISTNLSLTGTLEPRNPNSAEVSNLVSPEIAVNLFDTFTYASGCPKN